MTKIETFLEKLEKKFFAVQETEEEKIAREKKEAEEKAAKMTSEKLTDGTMLMYEGELKEGTLVLMQDNTPAPDGEHTFENGSVIAVQDGVCTIVKTPVAPPSMEEEMAALKLQVSELTEKIESIKPIDNTAQFAKIEETQKDLFETIKAFIESKDDTAIKDKFKKAELNKMKVGDRAQAFLNMNKN